MQPPVQLAAQYALTGSVVASAVGGIVLCLLIVRYGFGPPDDEAPAAARRRLFFTRLGHSLAAVCFAVTALLSVTALAPRAAGTAPGDMPARLADEIRTLEARIQALEAGIGRLQGTLDGLLRRVEVAEPAR